MLVDGIPTRLIQCSLLAAILVALILQVLLLGAGFVRAGEWEKTFRAAKKEGRVVIYGGQSFNLVFAEFQKKYPDINVIFVPGNASQTGQRIMAERRAGKYLVDVYIGGIVTANLVLHRSKSLSPIGRAFIFPEVLDKSKWWAGKHHYADPEGKYIFVFQGNVRGGKNGYNTKLVKDPSEFKSYWDFLKPKWKGKIVILDPKARRGLSNGLRFLYYNKDLGPKFLRHFFGRMDLTLSRNPRQLVDWLALGKFPIAFFVSSGFADGIQQGLPIREFDPNSFKEGAFVGPSTGSVALLNRAPHPNAAKVAINWLLSREGQTAYQTISANNGLNSMREDIPKDTVDYRRVKGVKYQYSGILKDQDQIRKLLKETLARSRRR